ncbi:sensor histidine kinase [Microbacterium sp. 3J1]|uniref:sensor histidine kinase n=1 Tax=Microbacterium sp. 3J1 TaxID=861269 RepID=UPI000AA56540|nr:sensor histidine kinase [Microbacterium sp. 3J1]
MSSIIRRERLGWDIASAALILAVAGLSFAIPESFPGSRWAMIGIALAVFLVYAWGARPYVGIHEGIEDPSPWVSAVLQVLMIGLLAAGVLIEPNMLLLQTLILPLIWMTSRSTTQAILVTVGTGVIVALAYAAWGGLTDDSLAGGFLTAGLSTAFSLALGLWITRIAEWGAERQRLLAELTAAQTGLETASREAGATEERARLARDVHDTIAQSLTSIVMLAERARLDGSPAALELIEDAAREALVETRALVAVTSPAHSADSLRDALRRLGDRFARETGMQVEVRASDAALPRDVQVVLLRCAQEGLANVRKHSGAGAASIDLTVSDGAELRIRDDGRGLGGVSIEEDRGFGLAGMRERVALVGGTLVIADGAERGTDLTVRIPLPRSRVPAPAPTLTPARAEETA